MSEFDTLILDRRLEKPQKENILEEYDEIIDADLLPFPVIAKKFEVTNLKWMEIIWKKLAALESRSKEELRQSSEAWRKELEEAKKEWETKELALREKIKELEDKLEEQQSKEIKRKRGERKKNVVIMGQNFQNEGDKLESEVKKFLSEELNEEVAVDDVCMLNPSVCLLKLVSMEDKKRIMKAKSKLKYNKKKIFINDDLIPEDRNVQKKLREKAKQEAANGKKVRLGFRRIEIDGKWYNHESTKPEDLDMNREPRSEQNTAWDIWNNWNKKKRFKGGS